MIVIRIASIRIDILSVMVLWSLFIFIVITISVIIIIITMSNIDIREGAGSRGLSFLAARSKSSASCLTSAGPVLELDAAFG